MLIETGGLRLLTDPVVRERIGGLRRVVGPALPDALDGIDAVLISHMHADHVDVPSLRRVGAPVVIAPRGAGGWFEKRLPGTEVREVGVGETERVGELSVEATPATHDDRRWPVGMRADPVGFVVSGESGSTYFAGDTDLFPEMSELAGRIDLGLIPVAGWGPKLGPGHLDAERAAEAAERIAPRVAVPIHWGTLAPVWPLKGHPDPGAPPRDFERHVARHAPGVEVRVLSPGERTVVS